jgi:hypothetical protein
MGRRRLLILSILLLAAAAWAGCGGEKRQLAGKAVELMNTPTTEKLAPGTRIQGKVAVVETYPGMSPSLEGFKEDGSVDPLSAYFFSPRRKAQSVDEIDTLVKVICAKGKAIGGTSPTRYANECDVSLIDFKTKTLFARKRFVNDISSNGVSPNDDTVAATPSEQIKAYLRELSSYD